MQASMSTFFVVFFAAQLCLILCDDGQLQEGNPARSLLPQPQAVCNTPPPATRAVEDLTIDSGPRLEPSTPPKLTLPRIESLLLVRARILHASGNVADASALCEKQLAISLNAPLSVVEIAFSESSRGSTANALALLRPLLEVKARQEMLDLTAWATLLQ